MRAECGVSVPDFWERWTIRALRPSKSMLPPRCAASITSSYVMPVRLILPSPLPNRPLYQLCAIVAYNAVAGMPRKRAAGGWRTMSGVIEAVNWQENADELHALYKAERNVEARKRLLALWLVRRGQSVGDAAKTAGVGRRTLTRWFSWYRESGLEEVLSRVPGHGALGSEGYLSERQQDELVERAGRGEFRTYEEARRWVNENWAVA